ncbi:MAG: sugar phosphate isomerase/epimerase [Planctomycetes bacterium]|nr:sugar phosphate isomerase/epimerase [Planctomycetota bacterium]
MMKLCCLSLSYKRSFVAGKMDVWSFIEECRRLDLDGVDLHQDSLTGRDEPYLRRVKRACLDRGLTIACFSINTSFGAAHEKQAAEIEKGKTWLRVAQYLGAPVTRFFAGSPIGEADRQAAFARSVECLRAMAEYGETLGVVVALQNHNHGALARTGEDVLRFIREVNHPNFSHVLDSGQYAGSPGAAGVAPPELAGADFYKSIEQTAPVATHVRAKLYHVETGHETSLDYERIFNTLRSVHYNGWISIAYEGQEEDRHAIEKGVRFLRKFVHAS